MIYLQHFKVSEVTKNYQWHEVGYAIVPQYSVEIQSMSQSRGRHNRS